MFQPLKCIVLLVLTGTLLGLGSARAEELAPQQFATDRLLAQQRAMWILNVWAGVSVASGIVMAVQKNQTRLNFAGYQNIGWGMVNAAIATIALVGISSDLQTITVSDTLTRGQGLFEELMEEQRFSKILLVNIGLDVGYMLVGGALMYAAKSGLRRSDAFFGSGAGVVLQGAFLLVFDIWQAVQSGSRIDAVGSALKPHLSLLPQWVPDGMGLSLICAF